MPNFENAPIEKMPLQFVKKEVSVLPMGIRIRINKLLNRLPSVDQSTLFSLCEKESSVASPKQSQKQQHLATHCHVVLDEAMNAVLSLIPAFFFVVTEYLSNELNESPCPSTY